MRSSIRVKEWYSTLSSNPVCVLSLSNAQITPIVVCVAEGYMKQISTCIMALSLFKVSFVCAVISSSSLTI